MPKERSCKNFKTFDLLSLASISILRHMCGIPPTPALNDGRSCQPLARGDEVCFCFKVAITCKCVQHLRKRRAMLANRSARLAQSIKRLSSCSHIERACCRHDSHFNSAPSLRATRVAADRPLSTHDSGFLGVYHYGIDKLRAKAFLATLRPGCTSSQCDGARSVSLAAWVAGRRRS